MFAELVELGKRVRKGHDALKEEKCSWDIVIDQDGNFIQVIPCDITVEAEKLPAKREERDYCQNKPQETLGFEGPNDKHKDSENKHKKYLAKLEEYKGIQELSPVFSFYNKSEEVEKALKAFSNLPPAKQNSNMTFMVDSIVWFPLNVLKIQLRKSTKIPYV